MCIRDRYMGSSGDSAESKVLGSVKKKARELENTKVKITAQLESRIPRVVTGLALLLTVPHFAYYYSLIWTEYNDPAFYRALKKIVDWQNHLNIFYGSIYFSMEAMKFFTRKSAAHLKTRPQSFLLPLMPLAFSFATTSYWNIAHNGMVFTITGSTAGLLLYESYLANIGRIPYSVFQLRYRMTIFTFVACFILFYATKGLRKALETRPQDFAFVPEI
eukprot:TRINITY_DN9774_c0_g1_i2.p1 TRINITY_DN9774_c0_g1~~TRINITY_DN9774_c0_g1_i2.p1  ORF type:complete len:218 (-),score=34.75 TRINITY_DN9774_c0_g1_i2:59-712(-)